MCVYSSARAEGSTVLDCTALLAQARSFDTESSGSSYATGFIVDAARGLIVTNRHVVTPGEALPPCCKAGPCARQAAAIGRPS